MSSTVRIAWRLFSIAWRDRINYLIVGDLRSLADFIDIPRPKFLRYAIVIHGTEIMVLLHPTYSSMSARNCDRLGSFCSGSQVLIHSNNAVVRLIKEAGLAGCRRLLVYPAVDERSLHQPNPGLPDRLRRKHGLGNESVILCVARLDTDKGQDVLLGAFSQVLVSDPAAKLILVGDGPKREELQTYAESLGIRQSVVFAGEVPASELRAYYRIATLFVMASRCVDRFEGFGIVFVEAALCKKASIAGDQGGVREAVEGGVTGLLVDPTSSDAVAEAIVELLKNPERRIEMEERAYQRARMEFSLERMAESLFDERGITDPPPMSWIRSALGLMCWGFQLMWFTLQRLPGAAHRRLVSLIKEQHSR
jgi:glycosyltransferase involved in cell wall biosynthesis